MPSSHYQSQDSNPLNHSKMYAVSYTAAIVLAGFWTTVSVFSQSFARAHYKPPMVVVMRRKQKRVEAPKKKTRRVKFELPTNYTFGQAVDVDSAADSKRVKAPKLFRSFTTFVGTHRRCSSESSDGSSESDTSSISSSDSSSSSSSSSGSRPTRPTFRRAKTSPGRQERKSVSWADETGGEM
ncbi:hypothetical protein AURDEDRAFT_163996 [Auricularia subglabra TFB-10046 SS5]|nr:hypothetical protein AURDEDRAFT_163996 [Auricularia subglabra TFB-10046 SS5]